MTDDKKKAERHFNQKAIKESVERMKPEIDCSVVHSAMFSPRRNKGTTPKDLVAIRPKNPDEKR